MTPFPWFTLHHVAATKQTQVFFSQATTLNNIIVKLIFKCIGMKHVLAIHKGLMIQFSTTNGNKRGGEAIVIEIKEWNEATALIWILLLS